MERSKTNKKDRGGTQGSELTSKKAHKLSRNLEAKVYLQIKKLVLVHGNRTMEGIKLAIRSQPFIGVGINLENVNTLLNDNSGLTLVSGSGNRCEVDPNYIDIYVLISILEAAESAINARKKAENNGKRNFDKLI